MKRSRRAESATHEDRDRQATSDLAEGTSTLAIDFSGSHIEASVPDGTGGLAGRVRAPRLAKPTRVLNDADTQRLGVIQGIGLEARGQCGGMA